MRTRTKAERNYDGYPEEVQRILEDADGVEDSLRATIEHMKETINAQNDGLKVQGREVVRLTKLQKGFRLARKAWKLQKADLEAARGAVDLRPVFLMELIRMYPEMGKLIEVGPHNLLLPLRGAEGTPGNWSTELFEWCYPQVDDLPGSDEDPDQEEYIAGLEAFEGDLATATHEGIEANKRNAATAEGRLKINQEAYKRLAEKYPKK